MTSDQDIALAMLPVGAAAVFTDGEDASLLIQISPPKGGSATWPTNGDVRNRMVTADQRGLLPADCDQRCLAAPLACRRSRVLIEKPAWKAPSAAWCCPRCTT